MVQDFLHPAELAQELGGPVDVGVRSFGALGVEGLGFRAQGFGLEERRWWTPLAIRAPFGDLTAAQEAFDMDSWR